MLGRATGARAIKRMVVTCVRGDVVSCRISHLEEADSRTAWIRTAAANAGSNRFIQGCLSHSSDRRSIPAILIWSMTP